MEGQEALSTTKASQIGGFKVSIKISQFELTNTIDYMTVNEENHVAIVDILKTSKPTLIKPMRTWKQLVSITQIQEVLKLLTDYTR
jgi:hypothetical protein